MAMFVERLQDLSMYYYIKDVFFAEDGGKVVTVVDDFPTGEITLPTVSVENYYYSVKPFELGNRTGIDIRTWYINVFAKNKSQRDDYAYLIINSVQNGIPVYDYNEGFPPEVSPTRIGAMDIQELEVRPIPIFSELVTTLYYRAQVKVVATYNRK